MQDTTQATQAAGADRTVRSAADEFVRQTAELNPLLATTLGLPDGQDELPDLSPAGRDAIDELQRGTLSRLEELEHAAGPGGFADADERRCARLLRERLQTDLAISAAGEHLRAISTIFGPPQQVRNIFLLMPAATTDDWAVIGRRIGKVPDALAGYRQSLTEGSARGLLAAPRQVETVAGQLADWLAAGDGRGWFTDFVAGTPADGSAALRSELQAASAAADAAVAALRAWLLTEYLPAGGRNPGRRRRGAVPGRCPSLERGACRPCRGLRLGLGTVPANHG
jgi:uncharacterized protein (DUF885 family)